MKKKILFYNLLVFFIFCSKILPKSILDGTTNIQYVSDHLVFHDEGTGGYYMAQGFVRLNNGFTVISTCTAFFDTFITVSGGIDLKRTGQIELLNDLTLDANVTLSSGGKINGRGNAIFLEGNLTIPDYSVLNFCGDTIIDGNGNELIIGDAAQLTIDMNKTLTLRNLTLKNTYSTFVYAVPPIRPYATNSKVAFDNVRIEMSQDFLFTQGQFFIHNDVEISGTYKFSYRSIESSFITENAQLYFDKDSTFEFYPSTTYNNLIIFQNSASSLYLDGCTLITTNTGMRLADGRFFLDNQVTLTQLSLNLSATGPRYNITYETASEASRNAAWHPGARFVFDTLRQNPVLYRLTGHTLRPAGTLQEGDAVYVGTSWSPDGNFLAIADVTDQPAIYIYNFDGTSLSTTFTVRYQASSNFWDIAWHPDGYYLAAGNFGLSPNYLYKWNGKNLNAVQTFGTSNGGGISWNPNGKYLASGETDAINIYEFNGSNLSLVTSSTFAVGPNTWLAWNPQGNLLFSGKGGGSTPLPHFNLFQFNGSSLSCCSQISTPAGSGNIGMTWSRDGNFVVVANSRGTIFGINNLTLYRVLELSTSITGGYRAAWSPDGHFIFLTASNGVSRLFYINYLYDPNLPAINNSLVLGNSALNQTLDTQILGNANVILNGSIFFDEN
ncbi:hypothetical protein K9M16_01865 [Candidatus Babeliales bacterium]|nr:hypothetical protein [Candidatus Babeliales bacterium]